MKRAGVRGFTLVELLVVVAVVAILATLAAPKMFDAINASRQAKVERDLRTIQDALERHYTDHSYYPRKFKDLVDRGYLKRGTNFRSPVSGHWYFYAVDDNRYADSPRAYALGAPEKNAEEENDLYPGRPLPKGRNPMFNALAWLSYSGLHGLNLYTDDSAPTPIPNSSPLPVNLAHYRTSCQGASTTCDLITN